MRKDHSEKSSKSISIKFGLNIEATISQKAWTSICLGGALCGKFISWLMSLTE